MKSRMLMICLTVALLTGSYASAQDCATCSDSSPCNTCAACCGRSCELFGGLRSLLACRPCVGCGPMVETCAPAPCGPTESFVPAPCGPTETCAPAIESCGPICETPIVCGPIFPHLKPVLVNAVHRPFNGACKLVHGVFGTLADVTAPTCGCGLFADCNCAISAAGVCGICGDTCGGTCGICEATPEACGPVAAPACGPLPEIPEVPQR